MNASSVIKKKFNLKRRSTVSKAAVIPKNISGIYIGEGGGRWIPERIQEGLRLLSKMLKLNLF